MRNNRVEKLCFAISCNSCNLYAFNDLVAIPGAIEEASVDDETVEVIADDSELSTPHTSLRVRRRAKGPPSLDRIVNSDIPLKNMSRLAIEKV